MKKKNFINYCGLLGVAAFISYTAAVVYPGEDVVEIINLQGETTTVYKLVDGRYMDRTNTVYIYDGKDTWTDTNGVEWNQEV